MYSQAQNISQNAEPPLFETGSKKFKKWHRRWWGKVLIAVLVFGLALIIAFAMYVIRLSYLIRTGQIDPTGAAQTSQLSDLPTMATVDDPSLGPADATVVIVEFSDFQCPFCGEFYPVFKRIISDYGDQIRYVYRDFPLVDIHPQALPAALAANCAYEQGKFWEMHDKIFENQQNLTEADLKRYAIQIGLNSIQFGECFASNKYITEIENDYNEGIDAGVEATPTFFINGTLVRGAMSYDALQQIIVSELNR